MGGVWEKLIRSVKDVLAVSMRNTVLTDAQLYTLITEVKNIQNRRFLITISDIVDDLDPLTPNHILLGVHQNWNYICNVTNKDISRKRYRQVQAIKC